MTEREWVKKILGPEIQKAAQAYDKNLAVAVGRRLPYAYQVRRYGDWELKDDRPERRDYETDVLVYEGTAQAWTPRMIIEAKTSINTHDAITYSQKAAEQKSVHPYLRYGMLGGNREHLPGRLLWHGTHFDFMVAWKDYEPSENERKELIDLVREEVKSSRELEKIFFDSQKGDFEPYRFLRRSLILKTAS